MIELAFKEENMQRYVYVIEVYPVIDDICKISMESYESLLEAQEFIESRTDKPMKETEFIYQSQENRYLIHELYVKPSKHKRLGGARAVRSEKPRKRSAEAGNTVRVSAPYSTITPII